MSLDFIKKRHNSTYLAKAKRQRDDILRLVQSDIQENVTIEYIKQYAELKYQGEDQFLNWIKNLFREANFISFFKYYRNPLPSAKLIQLDVVRPLSRVFYSEDAYFKYQVKNETFNEIDFLKSDTFSKEIFDCLLFNYNDIIVTDLSDVNTPTRYRVGLDSIISIDVSGDKINRIAYSAEINSPSGEKIMGYAYIDADRYQFYSKDDILLNSVEHDLQECPAIFISSKSFGSENIVRESVFSYIRAELEEYVFLKTLLKMSNAKGVIPFITKAKTYEKTDGKDTKGQMSASPTISNEMGSQKSQFASNNSPSNSSILDPGTIIELPPVLKSDGSWDIDAIQNWVTFHHAPIEPLEYMNKRIQELKDEIITSLIGIAVEHNQDAKNEMQVKSGFVSAEDSLRMFAKSMTRIRTKTDYFMLALKYGKDRISVDGTYGTDFFWESTETLYELFEKAPNVLERRNILTRIAKNRNKHNREKSNREVIMYKFMPYISDKDFESATASNKVDDIMFHYQTRFEYWISMFEAEYGDLPTFWDSLEATNSEKQIMINALIVEIIKNNTTTPTPAGDV